MKTYLKFAYECVCMYYTVCAGVNTNDNLPLQIKEAFTFFQFCDLFKKIRMVVISEKPPPQKKI